MQQQQAGDKPQGGLSWVYNDLPVTKFKVLGIIQIVIGSIYLLGSVISSSIIGFPDYYGYYFGSTVLGSGVAAIWTTKRKDKMLVVGTGLLALIAAILIGIVIVLNVIAFIWIFVAAYMQSGSSSSSQYSSSYQHSIAQHINNLPAVALIVVIISFLFIVAELIISIVLALTTKRVVDNLQPVAPAGAAPVTFEKV